MTTILGYLGALLLGACAVPLFWSTLRFGHARGVSLPFLLMWFFGELAMAWHVSLLPTVSLPLLLNYTLNLFMVGVVAWYRLFPRATPLERLAKEMDNGNG